MATPMRWNTYVWSGLALTALALLPFLLVTDDPTGRVLYTNAVFVAGLAVLGYGVGRTGAPTDLPTEWAKWGGLALVFVSVVPQLLTAPLQSGSLALAMGLRLPGDLGVLLLTLAIGRAHAAPGDDPGDEDGHPA